MAEPGWYNDGHGKQRWFDGKVWTNKVQGAAGEETVEVQSAMQELATARGADYAFTNHVDGRNGKVFVFSDRIEYEKPRLLGKGHASTEVIPLRQVTSVTSQREGMLWSVLLLQTAGARFGFRATHNDVQQAKDVVNRHVLAVGALAPQQQPQGAAPSKIDELVKLADLFKQGLLTEAEFTAAKANLIG